MDYTTSPRLGELHPEYSDLFEQSWVTSGLCPVAVSRSKHQVYLNYSLYGTGPKKILFIMGLTATHSYWVFQAKYFGSLPDYQVCLFDNRGIGFSSVPPGPYTTKMLALDAMDLLTHLNWTGQEQVHLVGVSMGGMVAQMMAIMEPETFTTVTLTSTYNSSALVVPTYSNLQIFYKMLALSKRKLVRPLLKLCFPKPWLAELADTDLTNFQLLEQNLVRLGEVSPHQELSGDYSQLAAALLHNVPPGKLRKLTASGVRCLVLHGTKDKVIRPYCSSLLASFLSCPLVMFRHSGHMLMIERELEFNAVLRAHIEGRPLRSYLPTTDLPHPLVFGTTINDRLLFTEGKHRPTENEDAPYTQYRPEEARTWSLLSTLKSSIHLKGSSFLSDHSRSSTATSAASFRDPATTPHTPSLLTSEPSSLLSPPNHRPPSHSQSRSLPTLPTRPPSLPRTTTTPTPSSQPSRPHRRLPLLGRLTSSLRSLSHFGRPTTSTPSSTSSPPSAPPSSHHHHHRPSLVT